MVRNFQINCQACLTQLTNIVINLGFAPPSNAYISAYGLNKVERYYPLRLYVCASCLLVQTQYDVAPEELFAQYYAYLSSTSRSWLTHSARYAIQIPKQPNLTPNTFVIEIGANDGYILHIFL